MAAPGTFAQGKDYQAQNSGVGPFIPNAAPQKDPFDSFLTTYDTVNKWRHLKEQEKLQKAAQMDRVFSNLKIDSKGIHPNDVPEVMQMQKELSDYVTKSYSSGNDPLSPTNIEAYGGMRERAGQFQTAIDGAVSLNTMYKDYINDVRSPANVDKFDVQELAAWTQKYENASMKGKKDAGGNYVPSRAELFDERPMPRIKTLPQLLQAKVTAGKPNTESRIGDNGLIQEVTSFGKKVNPQTGQIETDDEFWLSDLNSPEYRDANMQEITPVLEAVDIELPDQSSPDYLELKTAKESALSQKEAVETFVTTYNKNHPDKQIDFTEGWYLLRARNYGYQQVKSEGQDAYYKAQAKSWGVGQEEAKKYGNNFWQLANLLNGSDDFYEVTTDDAGNTVQRSNTFINQPAGTFDKEERVGENMKTVKAPNTIMDIQRVEDGKGNVTFRYKTDQTVYEGDDPKTGIVNGYRTTNDVNEVITLISAISNTATSGLNSGKFSRMFAEWSKNPDGNAQKGFWNEATKNYDLKKLRKVIPAKMQPLKVGVGADAGAPNYKESVTETEQAVDINNPQEGNRFEFDEGWATFDGTEWVLE